MRPLFDALLPDLKAPAAAWLDAQAERVGRPRTSTGHALTFAASTPDDQPYESRIAGTGCVVTRDHNWHDTFNAWVWLTFPLTKAAMNQCHAAHLVHTADGAGTRGPVRDALTQFDEDGLVLVSDDSSLLEAIRHHRWREAMFDRRRALESARVFVIGHALLDKARAPHVGLCARSLLVCSRELGCDAAAVSAGQVDAWLAARMARGDWPRSPRDLQPLPVLGLPGMTADNTCASYFDDRRQFRPAPGQRSRQ
ncbi:DUF3025 domain-containing protein [Methyloversatilis sp.]|uniref:DUF3025 domain-containing protein n=1 Tax=Methyloversatilis sp. TaxID=2569862 RepID=UPI003F71B03A